MRSKYLRPITVLIALVSQICLSNVRAQSLADGLVSYWPMDVVTGGKTPDLISGYDLSPYVGASHTLTNGTAIKLVAGYRSNCVSFTGSSQVLLGYAAAPGDQLPINQFPAFTVSLWVNAAPSLGDVRLFSEGNLANNNPLFNIGCNASGPSVDIYVRQQPTATEIAAGYGNFGNPINHVLSTNPAYDNTWHNLTFVQLDDGTRTLYIDGVADASALAAKIAGNWNVNATSIGGILRSTAAAWTTALIDDVALWKRALSQPEINEVKANGLKSVFPPTANGLVAYWPMDAVQGGKIPDMVNGYDLSPYVGASHTITNGSAINVVKGYRSNCVSFTGANQVLLGYIAGPNDLLPINKYEQFSVLFWVNAAPSLGDVRMFSEGNTANNNPLFNIGCNASGSSVDIYVRQQPTTAEIAAGYGNFGNPINHVLSTTPAYDNTWHHLAFVQLSDGTRTLYIDGVADASALAAKIAGNWNVNATSVGGILRSTAAAWTTGLIDEVALWSRALSQSEMDSVRTNGVPKTFTRKLPLQIRNFSADRASVVAGDTVVLNWEASADANLSISPGIGDVTLASQFGVGSTSVVVSAGTTYTLTATRGSDTTNITTTVNVLTGVAPGWRLIENFEFLTPGHIGGQGNWQNALSSVGGVLNPAEVLAGSGNKVLGFDGANVLAATTLKSMSIPEGKSNTLFFRFYLSPDIETPSPVDGSIPDLDINMGLSEKGLRDVTDFTGFNNGPSLRFFRQTSGAGGAIDLQAHNGVSNANGSYSYLTDPVNNPTGIGLKVGVVYRVWMDVQNLPFNVAAGVQNGGDLYSVYIQKEGDPARTNLFQNYLSDRDAVNVDPVLGAPLPSLTELYFADNNAVTPQGTNMLRFDDFFLSSNGFNSTVPVPAGSFLLASEQLQIVTKTYNRAGNSFALTWTAKAGQTFTVQKSSAVTGPWTTAVSNYPTGGATTNTVSFTDSAATGATTFYRISTP